LYGDDLMSMADAARVLYDSGALAARTRAADE
jgi:hypothetical protein